MLEQYGKVWGNTSPIFNKNNVEIHRIDGVEGGFCSKHRHINKFNAFYVVSGIMQLSVWKDYGLEDITILNDGKFTIVRPGQWHQFKILKNCLAFEIYWTELNQDDIERESVGGKRT